jgi:hypothetical protein
VTSCLLLGALAQFAVRLVLPYAALVAACYICPAFHLPLCEYAADRIYTMHWLYSWRLEIIWHYVVCTPCSPQTIVTFALFELGNCMQQSVCFVADRLLHAVSKFKQGSQPPSKSKLCQIHQLLKGPWHFPPWQFPKLSCFHCTESMLITTSDAVHHLGEAGFACMHRSACAGLHAQVCMHMSCLSVSLSYSAAAAALQ